MRKHYLDLLRNTGTGKKAPDNILLHGPLLNIHPVRFWLIDEEMVRKVAVKTKGGSGLSRMDAEDYHRILAPNQFQRRI